MRARQGQGYSLIEMLIVVGLLALIAAAAAPTFQKTDDAALDRAATEVARALRFAHSEAIRTGLPHGVIADQPNQWLKVYRLDDTVNPPVVHYDVYDPQTKQLYDLRFNTGLLDAAITQVYFKFQGFFNPQSYLGFSAGTGVPKFNDSGTIRMLENGYIRLGQNELSATIRISPMTGRVTIQ